VPQRCGAITSKERNKHMATERSENIQAESAAPPAAALPGPRGIGTGVTFDWALSVQLVIGSAATILGSNLGTLDTRQPIGARLAAGLLTLVFAAVIFVQGEALRRGRRVAWIIQIAANALLVIDGLIEIPTTIHSLEMHQISHLVRLIVLLVISPLIAWLLTRPPTRAWIASVSSAEARARHTGTWLLWITLWSIIGGTAIAFVGYY
jgi:hypothetical protein